MQSFADAGKLKELAPWKERATVVFMSDFGYSDGAVSAMHGVAAEVSGISPQHLPYFENFSSGDP